MIITNKQAFTNNVKKQFNIHYDLTQSEVTNYMVDMLADTIEFAQGSQAIVTDYIYNLFPTHHGVDKARNAATNIIP